ncbi:unnamed protein product, partial [Staurois parvus]
MRWCRKSNPRLGCFKPVLVRLNLGRSAPRTSCRQVQVYPPESIGQRLMSRLRPYPHEWSTRALG